MPTRRPSSPPATGVNLSQQWRIFFAGDSSLFNWFRTDRITSNPVLLARVRHGDKIFHRTFAVSANVNNQIWIGAVIRSEPRGQLVDRHALFVQHIDPG